MHSPVPDIDPGARQRLRARFGGAVEPWFDALPGLLASAAERWGLELGPPIPRGSVSAVFRCRSRDGSRAVLKASPDRSRLAMEASALAAWHTAHSPGVIAFDEQIGALVLEAIEPGTPLIASMAYPPSEDVAGLLGALHEEVVPDGSFRSAARRVDDLFRSSAKLYEREEQLTDLIPFELYDRGHALASRLAHDDLQIVLLHGDLTPRNILDGGAERGLVAIDPAPCLGDAAFDAVDLIVWQADDRGTIDARIERLAAATGLEAWRLRAWCCAFGGMIALELASEGDVPRARIEALRCLAWEAESI